MPLRARVARALAAVAVWLLACAAWAQPLTPAPAAQPADPLAPRPAPPVAVTDDSIIPYQDRPIREIRLVGLPERDDRLVRNQIRARAGTPLSAEVVRSDIHRLNALGRFKRLQAKAQPYDDGSVALIYEFEPAPIIEDVQAVGNRQISDTELASQIFFLKGTPVDEYQLGSAKARILRLYRDKGYYNADVTIDQAELDRNGIVLFKITEGERLRVTEIRFEGANSFSRSELQSAVKTRTAGILESGAIDQDVLDQDVAALIAFYKDRGYLDVQADRQLVFSPNGREAIVKFVVREGPVYTLRSVKVRPMTSPAAGDEGPPLTVFTAEQVAGLLSIKPGDAYSADKLRRSLNALRNAYTLQGYVDVRIANRELRDPDKPEVDLLLFVDEGRRFLTGLIRPAGNSITQKKVLFREIDQTPDRPLRLSYDRVGERVVLDSERRIEETRLFEPRSVRITVQPEDPANPGYRDMLVEVKETNTGAITFGAAASSDGGVIGTFGITQRNFDLFDFPDSVGEFFSGQAFRGAGQTFDLRLEPGTESQTYQISLSDPYLFDTDYSGSAAAYFRKREYRDFDERRIGGRPAIGRRFGERWVASVFGRFENIDISDIDEDAIVDLFQTEGEHNLTGIGFRLIRSTVDSRFRPSRGTRFNFEVERVGAAGGDYDFTKISAEHNVFVTVDEDFLGYKTVAQLKLASSYIPEGQDDAPIFERYFLGGRTFRGFDFRTVSPKGVRQSTGEITNEPAGGTFMFFVGAEIEKPVFEELISVTAFIDTGTVDRELSLDNYRLSVGVGLRLYVPSLTPVPFAFDFGFPLLKRFGDRERVFSFSFDIPF